MRPWHRRELVVSSQEPGHDAGDQPPFHFVGRVFGQLHFIDTPLPSLYSVAMSAPDATTKKVWQEAELEALPEDGFIHEPRVPPAQPLWSWS